MQDSFNWLTAQAVTDINRTVVADSGEPHVLLDEMKLEAAIQRPYNMWSYEGEEDTVSLAVSYMVSIAQAHAYLQGNKRTGFAAGRNFLQNHGYDLDMPDHEDTAKLFIEVIERQKSSDEFQTHLERYVIET